MSDSLIRLLVDHATGVRKLDGSDPSARDELNDALVELDGYDINGSEEDEDATAEREKRNKARAKREAQRQKILSEDSDDETDTDSEGTPNTTRSTRGKH